MKLSDGLTSLPEGSPLPEASENRAISPSRTWCPTVQMCTRVVVRVVVLLRRFDSFIFILRSFKRFLQAAWSHTAS
ncbi:hypothetical protein EYF80_048612 [Liparis tanakae]|uniref:Uncharacterized protein n=1 Tax=Liparis tanakae TaxID=230148 RepID=A0A4Z2FK00_9TELE|nr:hypothetical protein EYF80_048612 [Liparis tanakae]